MLYLEGATEEKAWDLLQFTTTRLRSVSPFEVDPIKIEFMDSDKKKKLPTASVCFNILRLPTFHKTYQEFQDSMDIALNFGDFLPQR